MTIDTHYTKLTFAWTWIACLQSKPLLESGGVGKQTRGLIVTAVTKASGGKEHSFN